MLVKNLKQINLHDRFLLKDISISTIRVIINYDEDAGSGITPVTGFVAEDHSQIYLLTEDELLDWIKNKQLYKITKLWNLLYEI